MSGSEETPTPWSSARAAVAEGRRPATLSPSCSRGAPAPRAGARRGAGWARSPGARDLLARSPSSLYLAKTLGQTTLLMRRGPTAAPAASTHLSPGGPGPREGEHQGARTQSRVNRSHKMSGEPGGLPERGWRLPWQPSREVRPTFPHSSPVALWARGPSAPPPRADPKTALGTAEKS